MSRTLDGNDLSMAVQAPREDSHGNKLCISLVHSMIPNWVINQAHEFLDLGSLHQWEYVLPNPIWCYNIVCVLHQVLFSHKI
mmetsp:Transcript_12998/g.22315  ORF Transcript_12998/g.22315 Transcript_12998/m.22315 type:complete len:82 (+) Transcript_12998:58-303(+)